MSYQIDHFDQPNNGSITVEDQSLNQVTDLTFVGKNYPGYSQSIGENFLHLLENFASEFNNRPTKPVLGQLWYDTGTGSNPAQPQLKVWDSTSWVAAGSVTKSITRPVAAVIGDIWVDTANQQLYLWSGSNWILVGPEFSEGTQSGPKIESVLDTVNVSHVILSFIIAGETVAIVSKDSFTPKITIDGFNVVNQGINMSSKDFDLDGNVTNKFWGTAESANKLIVSGHPTGLDANNFLRSDVASTTNFNLSIKNNAGLVVGADLNTSITNTTNGAAIIHNRTDGSSIFIRVNQGGVARDVLTVSGDTLGVNNTNPTEALDVIGKIKSSNGIIVTDATDSTSLANGSIRTDGGLSVSKTLRVGAGVNITGTTVTNTVIPSTNNTHNLGSNSARYNTIFANNIGNPDVSTVFTGSFNGAFNGSVTGTATRLTSSTNFSLIGDVSSNTISFNGAQLGGVATFTTVLSADVISTKIQALDSVGPDELLINRVGTGLRKVTKTTFLSKVATVPIGSLVSFAGNNLPNGYLLCDGAEVLISSYPELYAVIGNTYSGSVPLIGVATFRLPDLRGRMAVGADNMNNGIAVPLLPSGNTAGVTTRDKDGVLSQTANRITSVTADTIGLGNGVEEKSILTANLPQHTHNLTGAAGTQFYAVSDDTTGATGITDNDSVGRTAQLIPGFTKLLPSSGNVDSLQINIPLNVMNPYLTINYIIYTGRIA